MTFLFGRRRKTGNRMIIDRLNDEIVAAVRVPCFYERGGVADTFAGRFEMLVLHVALVVRRLKQLPAPGPDMAQDLIDRIFQNLDPAMRELGVGDMAVPKRMKRLAEAFLGRSVAYANALNARDGTVLAAALSRNIYNGDRSAADLSAYVSAAAHSLDACGTDAFLRGPLPFPDAAAFMAEDPR